MRILLTISILFLLVACKAHKEFITEKDTQVEVVEKPVIHEVYKVNTVRDTVWNKDSVYIIQKGDTIFNTTIREFHHYSHTTDTIHSNDTITKVVVQPVEHILKEKVEVEVEKPLNWWQKLRMSLGETFIGAFILFIGYLIFIRKKKIL
jgi:uncharacterized protein YcfL